MKDGWLIQQGWIWLFLINETWENLHWNKLISEAPCFLISGTKFMQLPELKTDIKKEKVSLCNRATYEATENCILDYLITMETDSNLEVMYAFVISGA